MPIANAGADQTIKLPVSTATLDGSASEDEDGSIAYSWAKISGPAGGILSDAAIARPVANDLQAGVYIFELTVTDDKGATAKDQVQIAVNPADNILPVANAGQNQIIQLPLNTQTLDGSSSSDEDGRITAWKWVKVSGPSSGGTLSDPSIARPVASNLQAGVYIYELTVTDDRGGSAKDQVSITVNPADNILPVANAGQDQTLQLPVNLLTLDGTQSSDADGRIVSYGWVKVSGPAGGSLSDPALARPVVTNLQAGVYIYSLTVTDDKGDTATDQVRITVNLADNKLPGANAGADQTIHLPVNSLQLDGTLSEDTDGTITFLWTKVSGPAAGSIANSNTARPMLNGLVEGTYIIELTVTDDRGASAKDQVKITVGPAENKPPVANAGPDQAIRLPVNSTTLDGSLH